MASNRKWYENRYNQSTIITEIPTGRTIAQFRGDMNKVVTTWVRRIRTNNKITTSREEVNNFLNNLETIIDILADDIDRDDDKPEVVEYNERYLANENRWLNDIALVRSDASYEGEVPATPLLVLQEQEQPQRETRQREANDQVNDDVHTRDIPRPQQQSSAPYQQTPRQDPNTSNDPQSFLWHNQSSFFRRVDESRLPPGLRESGRSFMDRLPNSNATIANSTMIYDDEATPTLDMFENPIPRVATQGRVKRWANFRGDGQSVQHFSGDALDFARYAKRFYEEVAENPNLSWSARYEEFSRTLPPDVRRKALDGTEANREGYLEGWEYLYQVYYSNFALVETCKAKLEKIPPVHSEHDIDELHELCMAAKRTVRAMLATGADYNFIDSTVRHMITQRCPKQIRMDLTTFYGRVVLSTVQIVDHLSRVVTQARFNQVYDPPAPTKIFSGGGGSGRTNAVQRPRPRPQATTIAVASSVPSTPTQTMIDNDTEGDQCTFCESADHVSAECQDGTTSDRSTLARRRGLCFRCLRQGHRVPECRTRMSCSACNGNHPRSLCRGGRQAQRTATNVVTVDEQPPIEDTQPAQDTITTTNINLVSAPEAIFMTTLARVNDRSLRVLLDTGCGISCVKQSVVHRLGWKTTTIDPIQVRHFGSDSSIDVATTAVFIRLEGHEGRFIDVALVVFPELTSSVATIQPSELEQVQQSHGLLLSNCTSTTGRVDIDIILGVYHVGHVSTGAEYCLSARWMVKPTLFGDILFGARQLDHHILAVSVEDLVARSTNENDFLDAYMKTIRRTEDGRYEVELPAITLPIRASNNKNAAIRRYHQMMSRARRENRLKEIADYFQELLTEGVLESVNDDDDTHSVVYLPCHYVIKEASSTTKLRAVFDGGAGKFPLNDNLFKGLTAWNLVSSLLHFRRHPVGIVADLAKAFLQVQIADIDRDYLRIWWDNRSYRFRRMPFGLSSSPFLLSVVLLHHLHNQRKTHPKLSALLSQSFYVDDLVISLPEDTNFEQFQRDSVKLLQSGKFDLRKWRCSDPKWDRLWAPTAASITTVLGLIWNVSEDTLSIPFDTTQHPFPHNLTKRSLASLLSSLYDPLGLFGPVMIRWRLLLRQAWNDSKDWDAPLSPTLRSEVQAVYHDSASIPSVTFPRHAPDTKQLVIFCDASKFAYGAVAYFGGVLMHSRSHLSRLKTTDDPSCVIETIPRLEWQALIIAGDMLEVIRPALVPDHVLILSDSKVCLDRLRQHPNSMKATLALQSIRLNTLFRGVSLGHVGSKLNRADILSRGASLHDLLSQRWWTLDDVPPFSPYTIDCESFSNLAAVPIQPSVIFPSHWSIQKQLNVSRFIGIWLAKKYPTKSRVSIAWMILFRIAQRRYLTQDYQAHLAGTTPPIDRKWNITTTLHSDGLIRVVSRLPPSDDFPDATRFPVLLDEHTARLVTRHIHVTLFHVGIRSTLLRFRETLFTRRAKQLIISELKRCLVCRQVFHKADVPPAGMLPVFRTTRADQFDRIGIDIFSFPKMKMVYGLMITCLVTRAIHVELVRSLSAEDLLLSLRAAFSLLTVPSLIVSDNGTNFRRTAKAFSVLRRSTDDQFDTQWLFNCPAAPFRGGVFERMIGTFKRAFRTISLHRPNLPYEQLRVVTYEICVAINSRPLYTLEHETITPNHFATRRSLPPLSADVVRNLKQDDLAHLLAKQRKLVNGTWTRWFKLYILELRFLHSLNSQARQHQVGDVVLVDTSTPRLSWPLATISEAHPGCDGIARTFTVKLPDDSSAVRPAQRLLSLEGTWSLGHDSHSTSAQ